MTNPGGYAFTVDADDLARSGEPEFIDYNDSHSPELVYPHEGVTPEGRNSLGESVFEEKPGLFYVEHLPHKPNTSDNWVANTILVPASTSMLLIGDNPNRKRLVVYLAQGSAANAYLSPRPTGGSTGAASGGAMLPNIAQAAPFELTHTGAVYVTSVSTGAATVCFIEESYC